MTTRCAWCGKLLKGGGKPDLEKAKGSRDELMLISHGVCPKCAEKLNAEIDELEES